MSAAMDVVVVVLLALAAQGVAGSTQVSRFVTARHYLSVSSENYPHPYPGPDTWRWEWAVVSGLWAVVFKDFQLACGARHDRLVISEPRRNLTFTCGNAPTVGYGYIVNSPHFSMQLTSSGQLDQQARGFKCEVLYGANTDDLRATIYDMQTKEEGPGDTQESGSLPAKTVAIFAIAIILPLVIIIIIGACVIVILRRRQLLQQSTTNTSVHLNIGAIRRDSAVSYTRHGNGPTPGVRPRLESDSSLSPDSGSRPKRPVKRSESNASWAMRAEMNTSTARTNDVCHCSSQGHVHADPSVVTGGANVYTSCPGESPSPLGPRGVLFPGKDDAGALGFCRLSTIREESAGDKRGGECRLSCVARGGHDEGDVGIANAGYMVMVASCSPHYANCGQG